ncbi:DUF1217 domain-containing protein [Rhodophyticola sp. CCM32]|uniref:DUF1217 domain-containing protein n=1 Tax=Rhodophyticola sp. CCM32 TaxID=2916397 RepID=UPI00107FA55E|nr:DUF1217 domain-containing protein [Rhodophyticola sp. CCM32]QBY01922.1 DUF1217 domain-containing protein [Rhodophyticola sp. CCM32]
MNFQPFVPSSGYSGWTFLTRTMAEQSAAFSRSPALDRDMQYFRENIGAVTNSEDLVKDYRLLRVALGAFGLQDDVPNKAFIRKVLDDGVLADDALANRLTDKRYHAFSEAFGFGTSLPAKTGFPGFANKILAGFERQEFELAIGVENEDMRLALSAERELPELAARNISNDAAWFTVLGNPPLRRVFETALGLPSGIGTLDLDQQLTNFKDRSEAVLGSSDLSRFNDRFEVEALIQAFTSRAQIASLGGVSSPAAVALSLLQNA